MRVEKDQIVIVAAWHWALATSRQPSKSSHSQFGLVVKFDFVYVPTCPDLVGMHGGDACIFNACLDPSG